MTKNRLIDYLSVKCETTNVKQSTTHPFDIHTKKLASFIIIVRFIVYIPTIVRQYYPLTAEMPHETNKPSRNLMAILLHAEH